MKTTLYLLRHAATAANLSKPARLQGQRSDPPLAPIGIRQAELTRDRLALVPIAACYSSPLQRALQTAAILGEPHGLKPKTLDALTECDVGRWEGLDWESIRTQEPELYRRFMNNPARQGYPEGESFAEAHQRAAAAVEAILQQHRGQTVLVVSHHVINRTYLAGLLGLPPSQARRIVLDNCGISVVVNNGEQTLVRTLNSIFHLQGTLV